VYGHDEQREQAHRKGVRTVAHSHAPEQELRPPRGLGSPRNVLALQRLVGNAETSRLLTAQRTPQVAEYNQRVEEIFRRLANTRGWQVNWLSEHGERRSFVARKRDAAGREAAAPRRTNTANDSERALTWFSTVVRTWLESLRKNPVEVQCSYNNGEFLISCNDVECNDHLASVAANGMREFLRRRIAEYSSARENGSVPSRLPDDPVKGTAALDRIDRHSARARAVLDSNSGQYLDILEAMSRTVRVSRDQTPQVHAEMRLLELTGDVTPVMVAGTRRPCLTCYLRLYPEGTNKTHPGHLYSIELMRGVDLSTVTAESILADLFARMEAARVDGTYRTVTQGWRASHSGEGTITDETTTEQYGSDSDA
jgi:hypothetical protein